MLSIYLVYLILDISIKKIIEYAICEIIRDQYEVCRFFVPLSSCYLFIMASRLLPGARSPDWIIQIHEPLIVFMSKVPYIFRQGNYIRIESVLANHFLDS